LKHRSIHRAALRVFGFCGLALSLAGCVEQGGQRQPVSAVPQTTNMARREGVSPHGASVYISWVDGVPADVSQRLTAAIQGQAGLRDVNLADVKEANYLVQGYLTAEPAEGGALYTVVYDVATAKKRLIQHIDERIFVPGAVASLDQIGEPAMVQIAAKSAEDIAAVMTNTPEAVAAATPEKTSDVAAAETDGGKDNGGKGGTDEGTTRVAGTRPAPAGATAGAASAYAAQQASPAQQAVAAASLR